VYGGETSSGPSSAMSVPEQVGEHAERHHPGRLSLIGRGADRREALDVLGRLQARLDRRRRSATVASRCGSRKCSSHPLRAPGGTDQSSRAGACGRARRPRSGAGRDGEAGALRGRRAPRNPFGEAAVERLGPAQAPTAMTPSGARSGTKPPAPRSQRTVPPAWLNRCTAGSTHPRPRSGRRRSRARPPPCTTSAPVTHGSPSAARTTPPVRVLRALRRGPCCAAGSRVHHRRHLHARAGQRVGRVVAAVAVVNTTAREPGATP
jgi:hypothetical protein